MSKHIISVLGGNGYIGKRIIDTILKLEPNAKVYAICRTGKMDPGHYNFDERDQVVKGDCLKPEPFQDVIKESTGIIHSIGTLFSFDADKYDKLNRQTCIEVAKIANNLCLGITMVGLSESLALGVKLGIDPKVLSDIMSVSTSRCWSIDTYNPIPGMLPNTPSSRDYENGFGMELITKDMNIALECAKNVDLDVELSKQALEHYEKLTKAGLAKKDFSYVYQYILKNKK